MTTKDYLAANEKNIAYDTIDGEVVIVHFGNGNYYSLNGWAAKVWQWLVDGHSIASIAQHVDNAHHGADEVVRQFTGKLVEENLMEQRSTTTGKGSALPPISLTGGFEPPQLEKHDDMQALIMLDPIHEVDETGWPNKAT